MDNQRVNIQYSIPLRDLPEEVIRLIEKINIELQFLKEIESEQTDVLSLAMFHNIDALRHRLAAVDRMCEDVNAIIQGYVSYQEPPSPQQSDNEPADEVST